jgi:hypothetical protein
VGFGQQSRLKDWLSSLDGLADIYRTQEPIFSYSQRNLNEGGSNYFHRRTGLSVNNRIVAASSLGEGAIVPFTGFIRSALAA